MNCQEFELIVHEMARELPLDAETRREGLAHISACASCARLLASSHSLSLGLRALAAGSALTQASASVEATLLEAFQRRSRTARKLLRKAEEGWGFGAASPTPSTEIIETEEARFSAGLKPGPSSALPRPGRVVHRPSRWEPARWVLAKWLPAFSAVAVLAVALGIRYWHAPEPAHKTQGTPTSGSTALSNATDVQPGANSEPLSPATESARQDPSAKPPSSVAADASESEFADFVPLPGFADPLDLETGEVVRVSLPSSAAADLGLPVIEDGEDTTIQAEVLIAEDGTARAVRFPSKGD